MEKQIRLTRSQVVARLREHAATHGFASSASLDKHDKLLLRCIPLYFPGLAAARYALGVSGPPYRKPKRKTGPKPGSGPTYARKRMWSRKRVIDELRRLHREGRSTSWRELMANGHVTLIHAAQVHAGGLVRARRAAGIADVKRRAPQRWTKKAVLDAIRARDRAGQSLAGSRVPQALYAAARKHFGRWADALGAVGIDPTSVRVKKYTKEVIVDRLQRAARDGNDLRVESLAPVLDLKAVRREFGTIANAIRAAGLADRLARRRHGGNKWTRARLVEVLRERAERGIYTMTRGLYAANQRYFGGTREARAAAGIPDPVEERTIKRRGRRARRFAPSRLKRKP